MKWETYYDQFYDLSPKAKLDYGLQVTEFPRSDQVLEIAYELDDLGVLLPFMTHALDCGVPFTPDQLEELVNFCDKELNRLLVFRHLDYFADSGPDYLDLFMYKKDFKRFIAEIGYVPPPPPKKLGLLTQLGITMLGIHVLDKLFDDD